LKKLQVLWVVSLSTVPSRREEEEEGQEEKEEAGKEKADEQRLGEWCLPAPFDGAL